MLKSLIRSIAVVLLIAGSVSAQWSFEQFENGRLYTSQSPKGFYYAAYDPGSDKSFVAYTLGSPVRLVPAGPLGEMIVRTIDGNINGDYTPFRTTSQLLLTRGQIEQLKIDVLSNVPASGSFTYQLGYVVEEPLVSLRATVFADGHVEFRSFFVTTEIGRAVISNVQRQKLLSAIEFYLAPAAAASSVSGGPVAE